MSGQRVSWWALVDAVLMLTGVAALTVLALATWVVG
jgi:hypothetical protein